MSELRLTAEEQALLDGAAGRGVQRAMEIVATLGRIYGAADLVPVSHAQIAGVSYKNLGDAGVAFLREWAEQGAQVRVPTTLNPMGMERDRWQAWGIRPSLPGRSCALIDAFVKMGVTPTMSCTPYLFPGYVPRRGDALAWSESSAVAFANSVLGARTQPRGRPERAGGCHRRADRSLWLPPGREPARRPGRRSALPGALGGRFRRAELPGGQGRRQRRALVRRPGRVAAAAAGRSRLWADRRATG